MTDFKIIERIMSVICITMVALFIIGCKTGITLLLYLAIACAFGGMVFWIIFGRCPCCGKYLGARYGKYCPHCGEKLK